MEFQNTLEKCLLIKFLIKQILKRLYSEFLIPYGPGEDLNYLKKGMVSIYCSYVWRNKPIIVKGSFKKI